MSGPTPSSLEPEFSPTTRRLFLKTCGALAAAPWTARAGAAAAVAPLQLPLHLGQLVNHIGISVPDVVRSATFYSHLFDGTHIAGQDKPALRYSISFYPGAMAIGDLATAVGGARTRALIDHFCVAAESFDRAAWRARLDQESIQYFAAGSFVDIDSIPVQLVQLPGRRSSQRVRRPPPAGGGFQSMPPLYTGQPLVKAHGFEHVMLHVSDVESSAAVFRKLFGLVPHESSSEGTFFSLGGIRLRLRQASGGEKPRIASYAIKVAKFDRSQVSDGLQTLGAKIEPEEDGRKQAVLRFADPDGIACELWAV